MTEAEAGCAARKGRAQCKNTPIRSGSVTRGLFNDEVIL